MRRFLTLVCLLFVALPAGITITGCYRNPAGNYCNGLGFGTKVTDLYSITLQPQNTGISMAFGQTRQMNAPAAANCKGGSVSVSGYSYGTTNNQLVDISPTGGLCAGAWNRNSGGGIPDYTICSYPNPVPSSAGLPYSTAFITASADAVSSNPVQVFVHAPVTAISLVGPQQCLSQTQVAQLDAEACYAGANNTQYEFCAPSTVTSYACKSGLAPGVTAVPACNASIGTLTYNAQNASIAQINPETNQITAELPGTTVINASLAQSGSSAGYFSTCPPASISLSLNGNTSGTVTQGVTQNMVTTVTDTNGHTLTGLTLDYQSTNPQDVTVSPSGAISANFPGSGSVYAICQPASCNPSPINVFGVNGTGLSISSNPVDLTVPGTASSFVWYGAPGQSQYFVPVELLTGTVGSTVRLPYVPNSMVMDKAGTTLYFGSERELMIYSTSSNSLTSQITSTPGVVLAVAANNTAVLVNDQVRQLFYVINGTGSTTQSFGGLGTAAQFTPDGKTLYVTDSASAGAGHTNTLYVFNANTGWTTYPLTTSGGPNGPQNVAITIPGVGAYISGNPTVAHTWCPTGTVGNYNTMTFYPQGDSVNADTDVLTATIDGKHILGAAATGGSISFSDIGVAIPSAACPAAVNNVLQPLTLTHTLNQTTMAVNATAVNQVVTSPAAVNQGTAGSAFSLSFVTYNGTAAGATLPYYQQTTGTTSALGTVGYLTLTGGSSITAPLAGAFSPDNALFFVSTAGDNKIHYINTTTLQDTQQISPNLPACNPTTDFGCALPAGTTGAVPATVIWVKPRATT
jgi:trimeric autotransporter adhesin